MPKTGDFFEELNRDFPAHPLKDRYLSELRDHWEDLQLDEGLDPQHLTKDKMSKKLGTPQEIKENFYTILAPFRSFLFGVEALFWGSLLALLMPAYFMAIYETFEGGPIFLAFGLAFLMSFFWSFLLQLFQRRAALVEAKTGFSPFVWSVSLALPSVALLLIFLMTNTPSPLLFDPSHAHFFFKTISLVLLTVLGAGAAHLIQQKRILRLLETEKTSVLPAMFFAGTLVLSLPLLNPNVPFFGAFFELFHGASFLFSPQALFSLLLPHDASTMPNAIFVAHFAGVLLGFLILQGVLSMLFLRRWSWIQAAIVLYSLSLFCTDPYFEVPYLNGSYAISERIERDELGPVYSLTRYWNRGEGYLFSYSVEWEKDSFVIQQNTGTEFLLNPMTVDAYDFSYIAQPSDSVESRIDFTTYPEGISCMLQQTKMEYVSSLCDQIAYGDGQLTPLFYEAAYIEDAALSEDGRWLMVVAAENLSTPEHVFMYDLNQLPQTSSM